MAEALLVAIALLAQAAGSSPASAAPAQDVEQPAPAKPVEPQASSSTAAGGCSPGAPIGDSLEIVVCAPRPQGYRIDPDILEANRAKRSGRPKRPERMADTSCGSVGPFGCPGAGAGINILGGAIVAATMAAKAIRGENVGQMFVTDPQRSEYDHYVEAKRQREAEEAEAAALAAAKAKAARTVESEPPPKP